jgi:hypothetical protein
MAIKIRCTECTKKISIDEAFAGGVCRCPYCKAIIMVPGGEGGQPEGVRPDAPADRPAAPVAAGAPAVAAQAPLDHQNVPMAKRVAIQNYLMLVVVGLAVLVMFIGAYMLISGMSHSGEKPQAESNAAFVEPPNPFVASKEGSGAKIAYDVMLNTPVVFVIDAGSNSTNTFDMSAAISRVSIRSMSASDQFAILVSMTDPGQTLATGTVVSQETASAPGASGTLDLLMKGGMQAGGSGGDQAAKAFFDEIYASGKAGSGKTDIMRTLKAALDMKPKTIVLFTRKDLSDSMSLAQQAHTDGVKIVTLCMNAVDSDMVASQKKFAEETGGESRSYGYSKLQDWATEFFHSEDNGK